MNGEGKMKEILRVIASQQTSVCVGIPEEGVKAQAMAEFLDLVVLEKFLSCVVVRSRSCDRIILEQDGLYLCSSCQELQQKLENILVEAQEEAKEDTEHCDLEVKMEPEVEVNDGEADVLPHSIFNSEPLKKMSRQLRTKLSCVDQT